MTDTTGAAEFDEETSDWLLKLSEPPPTTGITTGAEPALSLKLDSEKWESDDDPDALGTTTAPTPPVVPDDEEKSDDDSKLVFEPPVAGYTTPTPTFELEASKFSASEAETCLKMKKKIVITIYQHEWSQMSKFGCRH